MQNINNWNRQLNAMLSPYSKYTNTLCVKNLSEKVSEDDVKLEFSRFGTVLDVMIPLNYYTKLPKGYCFVEFEDYYQAEDAFYTLHNSMFYGRIIEIDYAKSDWKKELRIREQQQFLKDSCNIDEQKIMAIHALNMSGI